MEPRADLIKHPILFFSWNNHIINVILTLTGFAEQFEPPTLDERSEWVWKFSKHHCPDTTLFHIPDLSKTIYKLHISHSFFFFALSTLYRDTTWSFIHHYSFASGSMGRSRWRSQSRRWEEVQGPLGLIGNHQCYNGGRYHPHGMPSMHYPPSMHPDYNPFQHYNVTSPPPSPDQNNSLFQHRRSPSLSSTPTPDTELEAEWMQCQGNLKTHLVQTLNRAVQTIELWIPEADTRSSGSEAEDEMDWQSEREIVIPQPFGVRYIWDVLNDVRAENTGMDTGRQWTEMRLWRERRARKVLPVWESENGMVHDDGSARSRKDGVSIIIALSDLRC